VIFYFIAALAVIYFGVRAIRTSEPYLFAATAFVATLAIARLVRGAGQNPTLALSLDVAAVAFGFAFAWLGLRQIRKDRVG
jgi:hypothetical protein